MPNTVRDVMTRDVLAFRPSDSVEHAIRSLLERDVGGAPVVDDRGQVVGLLEDDDLIVQDARLHIPTVVQILGASASAALSAFHACFARASTSIREVLVTRVIRSGGAPAETAAAIPSATQRSRFAIWSSIWANFTPLNFGLRTTETHVFLGSRQ